MSTISHDAPRTVAEPRRWTGKLLVREMWAALTIAVIWLAVLFTAVHGGDIVSTNVTTHTTVPSAVVVAFFAFLATWPVAKYGFGDRGNRNG
jgi:hypothetical protein